MTMYATTLAPTRYFSANVSDEHVLILSANGPLSQPDRRQSTTPSTHPPPSTTPFSPPRNIFFQPLFLTPATTSGGRHGLLDRPPAARLGGGVFAWFLSQRFSAPLQKTSTLRTLLHCSLSH